ncbi:MAG: putative methyltransferase, UbiE/COQ5 family [Proteobacteria bacterium]|nr:putative methyltransferase, UbiE/COQ5 family [Pseudomonadota bacterium]
MTTVFQAFFSRQLAKPSGLFGRLLTARWLEKANAGMNSLTLDALALKPGDRLLELGFGSGYLLEKVLANRLCDFAAGADISPEMVRHVGARLRPYVEAGKAQIRDGDIEAIPFADGEFTKLCSVNTLYFWKDPQRALAECRRVLAVGGRLALCFNAKSELAKWPGHVHGFTLYELADVEAMLAAAGFCRIETANGDDPEQGLFHCVTGIAQ